MTSCSPPAGPNRSRRIRSSNSWRRGAVDICCLALSPCTVARVLGVQFFESIAQLLSGELPGASQLVQRFEFPDVIKRCKHTDRKSTRLNSSHLGISYAVFC